MRSVLVIVAGTVVALFGILGLIAWNAPAATNPAEVVQVSREAGGDEAITVSVTRADESIVNQPGIGADMTALEGRVLPFAIAVDTHAGDISELDLNGKVFLREGTGMEIPGIVKQLSVSAHHTSYVAVFPKLDSQGKPLADPSNRQITMVLRGVGSVPDRTLQWDLMASGPAAADLNGLGRLSAGAVALMAILGGFLALMSPCMLHTTSYWFALVTGSSTRVDVETDTLPALRAGVMKTVLLYIAGFTLMYVVLGTLAGAVGSIASQMLSNRLEPYKLVLDVVAGLFMTMFGLHVTGLMRARWIHRLRLPVPRFLTPRRAAGEQPTAFAMGLSMAIGCVSCVGGTVFLGLMAYLGTTTWVTGLKVSLLYSLGLALPLLLLTVGLGNWLTALRSRGWLRQSIAVLSGATLLVVGVLTLAGQGELVEAGLFWAIARVNGSMAVHVH